MLSKVHALDSNPRTRPFTPGEVADLFGVSTHTVSRWARQGRLERLRLTYHSSRYTVRSVVALLAAVAMKDETPGHHTERSVTTHEAGQGHHVLQA